MRKSISPAMESNPFIMKIAFFLLLTCSAAWAQSPGHPAGASSTTPALQTSASAANAASDSQAVGELLKQVRSSAEKFNADVSRVRIDKWKTDAATKQQAQAGAASIGRNLSNAVPDLLQRIEASPGSLNANFRLYRNLNALYDTFSALVESAGAFGPREQYDPLSADIIQLDKLRHQVAERVDLVAGNNDAELARLRAKVAAVATGTKPAAKIVVNDEPKSKPKPKKKAKPAQSQSPTPAAPAK
jgi:hypothetical protein